MQITLSINGKTKKTIAKEGETVRDVLQRFKVNEETGLLKLNSQLVHPKTKIKKGDELTFVNIIYGG
ncbi:MAG: MoaD/ThiS family protein [Candidatus Micrarchaeota archaeon]